MRAGPRPHRLHYQHSEPAAATSSNNSIAVVVIISTTTTATTITTADGVSCSGGVSSNRL